MLEHPVKPELMKIVYKLFRWSWVASLPFVVLASFVSYNALQRYYTFSVRYDSAPFGNITIESSVRYEIDTLYHRFKVGLHNFRHKDTLETIELFIPAANLAQLESHLPQSGYQYVKGRIVIDGRLVKAKVKYRGDFQQHWAWYKKSWRIKTDKNRLFDGVRTFNLQAPKAAEQLNNLLALKLAKALNIIVPNSGLVNLAINRENAGMYIFVEQLREETLRRLNLMPADIYRGELMGKDKFIDSNIQTLFESPGVWDKMSINNHYSEFSKAPLKRMLRIIAELEAPNSETDPAKLAANQKAFSDIMDLDAWAAFSAFEALAQTRHADQYHNWRIYYDPWRQKILPIAWDPGGWPRAWRASSDTPASAFVISTALHRALFKDGEFLRKRNQVLLDFFASGKAAEYLDQVTRTVELVRTNINHDPIIRPPNPTKIESALDSLDAYIRKTFTDLEQQVLPAETATQVWIQKGKLHLAAQDLNPVRSIRLEYARPIIENTLASISYTGRDGKDTSNPVESFQTGTNTLSINTGLVAEIEGSYNTGDIFPLVVAFPAIYTIEIQGTGEQLPQQISIDHGNGLKKVKIGKSFDEGLKVSAQTQREIDQIGLKNWQLFWDAGSGFSAANSSKIAKLKPSPASNISQDPDSSKVPKRWRFTKRIPAGTSTLRVDLPPYSKSLLSNIRLRSAKESFPVQVEKLTLNMMQIEGGAIRASGNQDAYLSFRITEIIGRPLERAQSITLEFDLNVYTPFTRYQERIADGSLGEIHAIYNPVQATKIAPTLEWQGEIIIQESLTINQPLKIKPGTSLLMGPGASLVLRNRLTAEGTAQNPITIKAMNPDQLPWGTIALIGKDASHSSFKHCIFDGGSGAKGALFEYTAMLSIHDLNNALIQDCSFSNSHLTDDMVHVVYSDVRFIRTRFINAKLDALDIDMSKVLIEDSLFQNSGNDAIDLMTSYAEVYNTTLESNGDKGISIGENSQLLGVNLDINNNLIGLQSKDASQVVLYNSTLRGNAKALDAYKKNWRYDRGGSIYVAKSTLRDNKFSISTGARSRIILFDSYLDKAPNTKPEKGSIKLEQVDSLHLDAATGDLYGKDQGSQETRELLRNLPEIFTGRISTESRGNRSYAN